MRGLLTLLALGFLLPAGAQHPHDEHDEDGPAHNGMPATEAGQFLMRQASGTAFSPASAPMDMIGARVRDWHLMFHGLAFVNNIQQTGPRGRSKLFSTNWLMGMAERPLGRGSLMLRSMLSLEPATVTGRYYPLLFQTGEVAFGRPIVDGQHPHEFFMELSAQYARPLGERTFFNAYFAPVGEPALGPVPYPHRVSAMELPQAALGHHLQDSTHIANSVVTAGISHGIFRLEASGFHGREPDEFRWNIDTGPIDSWAGRLALFPTRNLAAQVSLGRLKEPEELEEGDIVRSTASITYNVPLAGGSWATSLVWGRNHKTHQQLNLNSYLLESLWRFRLSNYLTGRVELLDRDELFPEEHEPGGHFRHTEAGPVFRIAAYTLGYARDLASVAGFRFGLGGNFTLYTIPAELKAAYGDRPAGVLLYLRVRPGFGEAAPPVHRH